MPEPLDDPRGWDLSRTKHLTVSSELARPTGVRPCRRVPELPRSLHQALTPAAFIGLFLLVVVLVLPSGSLVLAASSSSVAGPQATPTGASTGEVYTLPLSLRGLGIPVYTGPYTVNYQPGTLQHMERLGTYTPPKMAPALTSSKPLLPLGASGPLVYSAGSGWNGISSAAPNPCGCTPPDTINAVGDGYVFEMVNTEGWIWTTTGTSVSEFTLATFFGTTQGLSDPQIMYDPISGRWFGEIISVSKPYGNVFLAVSQTSNPSGSWNQYMLTGPVSGNLPDQCIIAVDSNAIILSSDYFKGNTFLGALYFVANKSQAMGGGATPAYVTIGPQKVFGSMHPAYELTNSSTFFMTSDGDNVAGSPTQLNWMTLTGAPPNAITTTYANFTTTGSSPTAIPQPGGTHAISTDQRIGSSVYQNGRIYAAAFSATCSGGSLDCLHIWNLTVSGTTPTMQGDFAWSPPGGVSGYYPAVSLDSQGFLGVIYTTSSSTMYPSAAITGQERGDSPTSLEAPTVTQAGTANQGTTRFGDYSGMETDCLTNSFWGSVEYDASGFTWNTWVQSLSFSSNLDVTVDFSETGLPAGTNWTVVFNGYTHQSTTSDITFQANICTRYSYSILTPVPISSGIRGVLVSPNAASTEPVGIGPYTVPVVFGQQYHVWAYANPAAGGTVTPTSGWQTPGASVTFTATPNAGYTFSSWSGNGTGSYTGTANPDGLTLTGPITEVANFAAAASHTVTLLVNPTSGGGYLTAGATNYYNGQTLTVPNVGLTISETTNAGWHWVAPYGTTALGGVTVTGNTLTATGNGGTLYLNFTHDPLVTYAMSTPAACGGTLTNAINTTGTVANFVNAGTSNFFDAYQTTDPYTRPLNISAPACAGYTFTTWGSGPAISFGSAATNAVNSIPSLTTNATLWANYTATVTYVVSFAETGVQAWYPTWSVTLNGVMQTAAPGGTISFTLAGGSSYTYVVPTIAVNSWVQDAPSPSSGSGSAAASIAITFQVQDLLTTAVSPAASGSVSPSTGWVADGVGVSISAGPAAGYTFSAWTGTLAARGAYSGSNNPQSVTPTGGGINETADFVAVTSYAVTFSETGVQTWELSWSVVLNGITKTAAPGVSISFTVTTGQSYSYTVPTLAVNAWMQDLPSPASGSGSVAATVAVSFAVQDLLTMAVSPAGSGTVSPGTSWVADGVGVSISAGAASGYAFSGWVGSLALRGAYTGTNDPDTVTPTGGGINETADFVVTPTYAVTFSESGVQTWMPSWGVILNGVTKTAAPAVSITFNVPTGTSYSYTVATIAVNSWVQDVPTPASGSGSAAATLSVSFQVQDLLTMSVSPAASGSVSPGTGWVADGVGVSISAGPAAGYSFSSWTGTLALRGAYTGTNNPQTVTPSGGGINETANFAALTSYTVSFSETGVQTWFPSWGVTLNGVTKTAAPGVGISFSVATGTTYSYTVATLAVNAWVQDSPAPASGSGSVAASIAIAFTVQDLLTMAVSPAASGTASPSTGWVTNGVGVSLSAGAATGYAFSAWAGTLAARGAYSGTSNPVTVTPSGGGINETADFVVTPTYSVTFSETGVQTWMPTWGVTLNGVTQTAAPGTNIVFNVPTGTSYSYVVPVIAVNAWLQEAPSPSSGSGSAAATVAITFTVQDLLTMAVNPAGSGSVSPGTEWVTNGVGVSISAGPASGYAFNGWTGSLAARGAYTGASNPVTVTPNGGGINETADFVTTPTYTVSFSETGVQTWMPSWGVTLNGVTKTAAPGVSISFSVATGTSYSYTVPTTAVNPWVQDSPSPTIGSGSAAATIAIAFTIQDLLTMAVTPAGSGIASPSTGWVTDGVGVSISAAAASGYAFSSWTGSLAARGAYSGANNPQTVTPSGGGINETANFVTTPTYAVTFSESGVQTWMPSWGVILNGVTKTAAPAVSITFNVPTGTSYSYTVAVIAVNSWVQDVPTPASGSGSAAATLSVSFQVQDLLTMSVSPAASGSVSPGTGWVADGVGVSISAGPAAGYSFSSWTGTLALRGAYTGTNNPQTVTPSGGGINETANFAALTSYTVSFSETGVQTWFPSWGVTLNGVTKTAAPGVGISFTLPTGTSYSYSVATIAVNAWVEDSPAPASGSGNAAASIAIAFTVQDLLTMAVSPAGSGTASPSTGWVTDGGGTSISAGAAAGYAFSAWAGTLAARGAYSGSNNPQPVTPSGGGINETAYFLVTPTYAVTFSESGVQAWMPSWGVTLNGVVQTAAPGTNVVFNVPTGTSYSYVVPVIAVNAWLQDAPSPSTGSGSSTATIAVAFTVQDLLTMAVSPAGTGTVSPSTEWVTNGVGVSILAGAAAGYVFSAWAGSLAARGAYSGTSNPVTVTPSGGGINETADFVVAPTYTVTFSETGAQTWIPSWGVILNGVTKTAAPGVSISFSVATGTSYSYTVSTTAVNIWVQDSPSPSTGSGSAAATIAVAFTVQDQLTMAVSPAGSGVVSPGTEWVTDGASVSISAAAASGYAFSSWTGSLAARGAYSGANNPQTVTPSGGGINETADFMVTPTYAVTFSETGAQTWMPSWGVILNGVTKTAAPAVSITFNVPTGTSYSYTVATIAVNSWVQDVPTPASGSGSAAATLSVSFQVQDLLTMSVSPAASGSVSPGTGWVADSIGVSISAGPASGYAFTSWSGTPSARGAYSGTNDPQTVTPSGGGINETANFAALTSYTVSFSETGVQTWFPSWGVTLNGVSKTAAPGVGISFSVATGTTYSYTVATVAVNAWVQDAPTPSSGSGGSAASISVAFAVQDLLTMVVSPAASGFVSPATGWVADGVGVSISAGAAAGYAFSSWAGSPSARGAYSGTNDPQTITPLGGGLNETANFVAVPTVPLTFLESGLPAGTSWSVTLNGVTSSATGKNITFNATQATYGYSLLTPIAGGAGTQYTVSSPAPSGTTTVTWHQTVAVAYTTQYQLTTVASPAVGGTVSPASGTWYAAGSPVTVSAVAAAGYAFSSWTGVGVGAYSGGNDPATITMGSPITETANFASTPTVPVTFLESGLPPSTSWSVSLNGVSSSATGKNVTFNVTAGSYTYSLATPIAGGVGVQYVVTSPAAAGTLSVTWHQTQAVTYTTQYQLTTAASPPTGGTVSPASGGWYDASTSVTLSAVTAAGYAFTGWSCTGTGCYSGINDPATFSIAAPTTETASFVAVAVVPVTFLESGLPTGTSWSVILNGVAASATGQNITFNVTAGTYSYTILTPIAGGAGVQYVVTSPAAAGAITVSWHQTQSVTYTTQYQLTMVASPAGAGTVSPTSGGWYNAGSGVTLTAVAAGGYAFASWSCVGTGCYAGTNDPASFTISAATTETANFASVPTVPMTFLESGLPSTTGWSVTLNGVTTSATGANITFNVTQATYSYAIMSPISGGAGVQYVVLSPASSGTLTVTWHQTQAVAYATQYQLTTAAAPAGSGTVSPASGSWYTAGSSVTLSAVASTAYAFSAWSCTGTGCYAGTNDPATVTVGSPTTETADFVATPTVPVSFVEVGLPAGSSWSVTLNGVAASASGQNVTFNVTAGSYSYALATPISGGSGIQYVVSSPSAAGTLAVTWHQTQSVVYATQFQLTMTVAPVGGGTVSPSSGNWYPSGSLVTLTAVAASGYAFSSWSCAGTGCYSGTNDPATLAIAGPTTETGNFVATPTVPLSFMESGLPGGTSWSVTLNGVAASASGSNVTFNVTAGTYSYALLTPIPGGTGVQYVVTSPSAAGTVVVSWHGTQSVAYGTQYQLTMVAAPAGGGTVSPTSGSWYASGGSATLSAVAAAGYAFSSWSCTGTGCYAGTSDPATLTLAGPTTETADFVAVPTVPLTFLESGLPAGTSWSVTLNGVAGSATGQNITFNVTQASYSYAIAGPIAGALGVQYAVTSPAASGTLSVTWHATEAVVYTTEYQLTTAVAPSGSGSVSPATGSWSISGSSVTLSAVAAAGYVFSAWSCSGTGCYAGSSDPATFSIGGPTTETAGFMAVTTAPIAFLESGLPGGTLWSVALNGVSASSTGQNLTFNVTAGSYTYSVSTPIAGAVGVQYLVTSPSPSGTVTVGASHVTEAVTYSTQYQLTTTVAPLGGGAVSPVSGSWYDAGSTLTLTAVASSGYAFTSWTCSGTGCYAGTSDPASFAIAGPTTETANFAAVTTAPVSYLESGLPTGTPWSVSLNGVSVSSSGQNITFNATAGSYTYAISTPISGGTGVEFVVRTPSPSGTVTVGVSHLTQAVSYTTQYQLTTAVSPVGTGTVSPASGTWYDAGSGVTVTAVPSPGYSFSSWTCLGTGCYSGTNDPATFVIGGATTETANFVPLPSQVPVSFLESGLPGGTTWSVTLNGIVGTASGQNITFNVTAGTYGYSVETPIAGATGVQYVATSSASGTLTVGSSFLVQAVGYGTEYQLSTAATPAGSGSVSPTSGGWYASGATVSLTALPASGYTFSVWTCTGAGCYAGTNDPATLTMGAPTTETASFTAVAATYAVTFTESGLAPGTSWWVALNGATEASTTTTIVFQEPDGTYSYALETPVAGSAGVQYTATSGSGSVTVSGVPTGVAVPFATQYWVSVGASPAGGGSVSPSNGWTAAGLSVTLLATASPGWRFVSWDGLGNGNYSGTSDPATATANGPLTEVATFAPVTPPPPVRYEVSFVTNPATCGEVVFAGTGYGNGARVNVSAGSYGVSALACSGYVVSSIAAGGFVYWPGNGTARVSASGTLTALFSPQAPPSPGPSWLAGLVTPATSTVEVDGQAVTVDSSGHFNVTATPGTHTVTATASGYVGSGPLSVGVPVGSGAFVTITLSKQPSSSSTPTNLAGGAIPDWALLLLLILVIVGMAIVLAVTAQKRRKDRREKQELEAALIRASSASTTATEPDGAPPSSVESDPQATPAPAEEDPVHLAEDSQSPDG